MLILLFVGIAGVCAGDSLITAEYTGNESCQGCHVKQFSLWQGSHHDFAMQHADKLTVLGDFSNTTFTYAGITSTFFRNNEKFMVRTDGKDGKLRNFEIKYTFGVEPLQQYLIEFDDGRLQALLIAWDTRKKSAGGQRWFHLHPDEQITYKDELHWTGASYNWNGMCADCHSTNLKKNYDAVSNSFKTNWSEINVSCEACHGAASAHISWAENIPASGIDQQQAGNKGFDVLFDERKNIQWLLDIETGNASRSSTRLSSKEIDVCAQCHSRRSAISDKYSPGKPFLDHYMPRLLDVGMYHADGQIQDEVYVYGSFMQSKMQHQGVTCSDCHEPHSLALREPGNGVCLQCHAANKFETENHHRHKMGSKGASCADCHMPVTDYMVVDPRHDHSIRIPRPDLSVSLGTPNACNQCHEDKKPSWAAEKIVLWYKGVSRGYQQYAIALDASRKSKPNAASLLLQQIESENTPAIARASAISSISGLIDRSSISAVIAGLEDDNALLRMASVSALEGIPDALLVELIFPRLSDPIRAVRIEAARVLASIPVGKLQGELLSVYEKATNDYIESQQVNADRPEAQFNLGNYYLQKKSYNKAEKFYKQALLLNNYFLPAYINLADLYRQTGNNEAEHMLLKAIEIAPANASVYYSLGLLYVREKNIDKAVKMLAHTVELEPLTANYHYVYAVALNSKGKNTESIGVLQDAHDLFPENSDILNALVLFHRNAGNEFAEKKYMSKLKKLMRN